MQDLFASAEATVVSRNKLIAGIAAAPLALIVPSILAAILVSPRFLGATILSFIFGTLASGLVYLVNPAPKRDSSGVSADARGLTTRAGAEIPRAEISQGFILPGHEHGARVRLTRTGLRYPVDVAVADEDDGRRLLQALGLDAGHSIASFFGMSRVYASTAGFFANTALLFLGPIALWLLAAGLHAPALGGMALIVAALAYVSFFMPVRLKVGADGMVVSWYGRKRFISFGDVESATRYTTTFGSSTIRGIVLLTRRAEEIRVPLDYGLWGRSAIAIERINEAMEAYARGGESPEAAKLSRGERTPAEWLLGLRRLGSGAEAGPRNAAIASDTLWRIVENAGSKPSVRAAAAVALAPDLDESERARLRSIAAGTTAPKLRIALNAVSGDGDEAAIAEALGELEAEERTAEASS